MPVKRLLSIDGGGIRGVMAAAILVEIEQALREYNPKWQRLSDFFHFIGGTSTGSIIAAGLAKGMSASELLAIYKNKGEQIFTKRLSARLPLIGDLFTRYSPESLERQLKLSLGDTAIGSNELRAKLLIATKNITSGKTYIFSNLESNPLFRADPHVKLKDIVRGSSAAPTFFPPHSFKVAGKASEFIDGGVSMYNNPSFQVFLQSTQPEYGLNWSRGVDNLLLVSVGTGFGYDPVEYGSAAKFKAIRWAKYIVNRLMDDANLQQNRILKLIGFQPNQWDKDARQVIHRPKAQASAEELEGKLFTYFRFTTSFTDTWLKELDILNVDRHDIEKLKEMDCVDQIDTLEKIGKAVALEQFSLERFDGFLRD